MTLPQSQMTKSETSDTLTQFAEDFRAKLSALLDIEEDSKILEELSSLKSQGSPLYSNLSICSLKMSKDYSTTTKGIPLRSSSQRWMNSGMMWNGKCLTAKISDRECWRLQGFPDWAFDKAQEVNSNSQLYKQAGNSVTVNVIKEIARYL